MDFEFGELFSLGIWGGGFLPRAGHFGCGFADVGRGGLMAPTSVFLVKKLPPNVHNMHQNCVLGDLYITWKCHGFEVGELEFV